VVIYSISILVFVAIKIYAVKVFQQLEGKLQFFFCFVIMAFETLYFYIRNVQMHYCGYGELKEQADKKETQKHITSQLLPSHVFFLPF